jgi:hypothetical protein
MSTITSFDFINDLLFPSFVHPDQNIQSTNDIVIKLDWKYNLPYILTISFLIIIIDIKWIFQKFISTSKNDYDVEDHHLGNDEYRMNNNNSITNFLRNRKLFLKFVRFFLFFFQCGLIISYYYFQKFLMQLIEKNISNLWAGQTLASSIYLLVDLIWRLVCSVLTIFEGHKYFDTHVKSDLFKSYIARILLFSIFLNVHQSETSQKIQMANVLMMNTFLGPILDIFMTKIVNYFLYCHNCCSCYCYLCLNNNDNNDNMNIQRMVKMTFPLAEEYTQLMFRQYLIYQCIFFLPLLGPILGLISNFLEYWLDKYKLFHMCQKPKYHSSRHLILNLLCSILNLSSIYLGYPNGYIW